MLPGRDPAPGEDERILRLGAHSTVKRYLRSRHTWGVGHDLSTDACKKTLAGRGRPTAAGHYTARTQDFGMTLTFKF